MGLNELGTVLELIPLFEAGVERVKYVNVSK